MRSPSVAFEFLLTGLNAVIMTIYAMPAPDSGVHNGKAIPLV